jgi:HupE / UreJ protein
VRTVTGFTIGHSITLALASLGWLSAPGWIEPAIAVTIGVAAWLNLYPQRWLRGDLLALLFGLIHGVAFSEVIREAGIGGTSLLWALAGFNVGVELGQLLGVALWCVVHVWLVRWRGYARWIVRGGSWALLLLAAFWFMQRVSM